MVQISEHGPIFHTNRKSITKVYTNRVVEIINKKEQLFKIYVRILTNVYKNTHCQ